MAKFYEFFAGGGMARAGLGPDWTCLFANDFDLKKGDTYRLNWGVGKPKVCPELKVCDVREVKAADLPDIPDLIALENVLGTLTSHGGRDFAAICQTFANADYRYGALVINAALFVPQSRPRLFVIGVRDDVAVPGDLIVPGPLDPFHSPALCRALDRISASARKRALWWNVPVPARRNVGFARRALARSPLETLLRGVGKRFYYRGHGS